MRPEAEEERASNLCMHDMIPRWIAFGELLEWAGFLA